MLNLFKQLKPGLEEKQTQTPVDTMQKQLNEALKRLALFEL